MHRIDADTHLEFTSGIWNTPDTTALIVAIALGAMALAAGTLGLLGHQGISVGPFNAISSVFPKACCALVAGAGGALVLGGIIALIVKHRRDKAFKEKFDIEELIKNPYKNLPENKFEVHCLPIGSAVPEEFAIFTREGGFIYGSVEAFTAKVKELEQAGYQAMDDLQDVDPADPVPLPEEAKEGHPKNYWLGLTVTLICLPAFIIPFIFPFPYAWTVQTAALGVLTATLYGIVNDQMAVRQSIRYFTLGHTPFHNRLLKTDDPTANATIWGIHATWVLGAVAGVVLALVATVTHSCAINPLYMAPLTFTGSLAINLYSHIKSKQLQDACEHPIIKRRVNRYFNDNNIEPATPDFDRIYLKNVPEEERAGWLGVGRRNSIGYAAMPSMGVVLLVGIIAARVLLAVL